MKTQIMLDLETLGKHPGSVIVSIGAVKFDDKKILESFYTRVDPESCVEAGLRMDASTVLWWMGQNEPARKEICQLGQSLSHALNEFRTFVGGADPEVWGNGATFDNVLLSEAYRVAKIARPWKYHNERCYRTVKNMFPSVPLQLTGTAHNALDDATAQAEHLIAIMKAYKVW